MPGRRQHSPGKLDVEIVLTAQGVMLGHLSSEGRVQGLSFKAPNLVCQWIQMEDEGDE